MVDFRGGRSKSWILRAGVYPSETFKARQPTPLCGLLRTLSSPFKSLYASNPPNEAIRENYEKLKQANPDNESAYLNHIVHIRSGQRTFKVFFVVHHHYRGHVGKGNMAYRRQGRSKSPDQLFLFDGRSGSSDAECVEPVAIFEGVSGGFEACTEPGSRAY